MKSDMRSLNMQSTFLAIKASFPLIAKANSQARSERYNGVYPSMLHNTNILNENLAM